MQEQTSDLFPGMSEGVVCSVHLDEVLQFVHDNLDEPLTNDEIANLYIAFFEGADRYTFIHDAIRYLRLGDETTLPASSEPMRIDASVLGLKTGEWPPQLSVNGKTWIEGEPQTGADGDLLAVVYRNDDRQLIVQSD